MTKREFFVAIANGTNVTEEMKEFALVSLTKMDEANEKRKNTLTKKQLENEDIKLAILGTLSAEAKTATVVGETMEISTQKASALLRQLVSEGKASAIDVKVKGKGVQKGYIIG